jgi:hypothetical protein
VDVAFVCLFVANRIASGSEKVPSSPAIAPLITAVFVLINRRCLGLGSGLYRSGTTPGPEVGAAPRHSAVILKHTKVRTECLE